MPRAKAVKGWTSTYWLSDFSLDDEEREEVIGCVYQLSDAPGAEGLVRRVEFAISRFLAESDLGKEPSVDNVIAAIKPIQRSAEQLINDLSEIDGKTRSILFGDKLLLQYEKAVAPLDEEALVVALSELKQVSSSVLSVLDEFSGKRGGDHRPSSDVRLQGSLEFIFDQYYEISNDAAQDRDLRNEFVATCKEIVKSKVH